MIAWRSYFSAMELEMNWHLEMEMNEALKISKRVNVGLVPSSTEATAKISVRYS